MKYKLLNTSFGGTCAEDVQNYHAENRGNVFAKFIASHEAHDKNHFLRLVLIFFTQNLHLKTPAILKSFAIIIIFLTLLNYAEAQTLVAYYPLNGNANDSGANHLNGVISGGVKAATDRHGDSSHALSFDGQTGRIDVPDAPALRPTKFTLSAWFYISEIPSGVRNIATKNLCNSWHESFALWLEGGALLADVTNANIHLTAVGPVVAKNAWHLATMSFDENTDTLKLYMDGILINAVTANIKIAYDASSFSIGYELEYCSKNFFFDGKIDDVRLYSDVLTDEQVADLYDLPSPIIHRPGSGTALYFNGTGQYAALPSAVLANAKKFTIEYWIKTTENRSNNTFWQRPTMIGEETLGIPSRDFGITTDSGRVGMWSGLDSATDYAMLTSTKINNGKWHHIAAVNNGVKIILYVDGVLQDGSLPSGRRLSTSPNSLYIGASNAHATGGAGFYHQGEYDEFRIWDKPLTKQEIRDRMCHKISPSDSLYNRLVAYYNFDEEGTSTAIDIAHRNDAILKHSPHHWRSGAPIGDTSVNVYMYGSGTKSLLIAAASGETFQVTSASGQTRGLHLYVVNESPADTGGLNTLCAQNKYFGIFSVANSTPSYSGIFNYSNNKCVTTTNEEQLRTYKWRHSDSGGWYELPYLPNLTANTITISSFNRYNAKFILGLDSLSNAISSKTDLIKNTAAFINIALSPNPASSLLHVHLNPTVKENEPVTIRIIDQNYKEVWKNVSLQNDLVIDVHALAQGLYFIQFISQQGMITKKFIVNR